MRGRWFLLLLSATLAILPWGAPARAAGTSGGGTFVATLTLEAYPCLFPSCAGTLVGVFTGAMTGVDPASCPTPPTPPALPCHGFAVTWPDPTAAPTTSNLSGSFQYNESCPVAETGSAGGTYTITGGYVDDNGVIAHDGQITGGFSYVRRGLAFTMTLSVTTVSGNGHVLGSEQTAFGAGSGVFVPEDPSETCLTTVGQNVGALVIGSGAVPE
jgi:hypothetical protein